MPSVLDLLLGGDAAMVLPQTIGLIFFLLTLPLCLWTAWSDLRSMRILNKTVIALAAVFVLIAPFLMPLEVFGWQLLQLVVVLLVGIVMNALGLLGAGDAKFAAAAAPYIMLGDLRVLILLFAAILLCAVATHRLARMTPLRKLAPDWESWSRKKDFPMGLALGPTLSVYLGLAALYGS